MESKLKNKLMQLFVNKLVYIMTILGLTGFMLAFSPLTARAEVIDNIEIKQVGDQAEIQLHFITRIQYKRQLALKNGDIRIYLSLLDVKSNDERLTWEKKDSPPSDISPPFTVTYPELDSSLTLSFGKVLKYRVRAGKDGRSLSVSVKALVAKKKPSTQSTVAVAPVVTALPIAAAAMANATELPAPVINEQTGVADLPSDTLQK